LKERSWGVKFVGIATVEEKKVSEAELVATYKKREALGLFTRREFVPRRVTCGGKDKIMAMR